MPSFPARIHILLASHAPLGVIIRRGPSKHVATLLWNRLRDEFQLGQWLKGRIYERRSDLSPDGRYFIYFAMNGHWDADSKGAWTAISRAPYLKALALFAKGDCWQGGGLWTNQNRYWLNGGPGHSTLKDTREVRRDHKFQPREQFGGECLSVYFPRLMRDGWDLIRDVNDSERSNKYVFEKSLEHGWTLRKIAHAEIDSPAGKGCYWDEHELVRGDSRIACQNWEWADLDGTRLVWAADGKLCCGEVKPGGLVNERELYDFNEMRFEAIEAPY